MKHSVIKISDQGASFLKKGQAWMYANNLASDISSIEDGSIVDIYAGDNEYLATGFLSRSSHIVVRILTRQREEINEAFFARRIAAAVSFRRTLMKDNFDNCRLIFGEADGLPGLTVDRYNDVLVSEISCSGMEKRKDMIYAALVKILRGQHQQIRAVYERNDIKARKKEGLPEYKGFYGDHSCPTTTIINENGLRLYVDFANGQKTGWFLDQKANRLLVRQMAEGMKVLDCFTHTGGFALNAAMGGAAHVTAVDISAEALQEGRKNASLNNLENVSFVQADVFTYLDSLKPHDYDLIILDPPAFAKSRKAVMKAYNGYKHINGQAMKLLKGGGYLATCSCSRYMETGLFEQMLKEAAQETGVLLKQISVTQQNCDHPVLWTMEETAYLKFYIFQII